MSTCKPHISGRRQQGAALAISLILLLVMTIIGVAAMNGARQEITMAGLLQQEEIALRRAERTLAQVEEHMQGIAEDVGNFDFGIANDAYYLPSDGLNAAVTDWSSIAALDHDILVELSDSDEAVVEYLGQYTVPGNSPGEDGSPPPPGERAHAYRITTRSSSDGKAVRIVESIYTTLEAP